MAIIPRTVTQTPQAGLDPIPVRYGTPLQFMLDELRAQTLILTGVSADSCITMTALDAHVRQFRVWAPRDCVASPDPAYTHEALKQLKRVAKASTAPSTALIAKRA